MWNDGSSTILSKLSKLQRRAARVITGQTYDVRSTQILGDLSWIPIEDTLKRREIIMSFKALTDIGFLFIFKNYLLNAIMTIITSGAIILN